MALTRTPPMGEHLGAPQERRPGGQVPAGSTRQQFKGQKRREERALQLWNEHYGELAARCAIELCDEAVAHQIVQEAFTRLLARLVLPRDPQPYLSGVVAALTLERSRRAPHTSA
jgi:hypothetical protein